MLGLIFYRQIILLNHINLQYQYINILFITISCDMYLVMMNHFSSQQKSFENKMKNLSLNKEVFLFTFITYWKTLITLLSVHWDNDKIYVFQVFFVFFILCLVRKNINYFFAPFCESFMNFVINNWWLLIRILGLLPFCELSSKFRNLSPVFLFDKVLSLKR